MSEIYQVNNFIVHRIKTGQFRENCYLVECLISRKLIVIDPGSNPELLLSYIDSLNLTVDRILLTHGHYDHVGAVDELRDRYRIEAYAHVNEKKLIRQAGIYAYRFSKEKLRPPSGITFFGDDGQIGGGLIRILYTPGHTSGSVCYELSSKLLFTGDTLFNSYVGPSSYPTSNSVNLKQSIGTVLNLCDPDCVIFPGHGSSWSVKQARVWWREVSNDPPEFHLFGGG